MKYLEELASHPSSQRRGMLAMLRSASPIFDDEFGVPANDDQLPLIRLRERRRKLVMALAGRPLTSEAIHEIAAVQQAIKAVEAVIAE